MPVKDQEDGIIQPPEAKQKEFTAEELEYIAFIKKHRDRCAMWARANGNTNFPIIRTENGLVWVSRSTRRKMRKPA